MQASRQEWRRLQARSLPQWTNRSSRQLEPHAPLYVSSRLVASAGASLVDMGIVRTVEWSLTVPPDEAERRLREAISSLGMEPKSDGGSLRAKSARSLMKNRWS